MEKLAKKIVQIFSELKNSSLQGSLQKQQLNLGLQRTICLQPSLQLQKDMQAVCKEKRPKYQSFIKRVVCKFVCRNLKLTVA